MSQRLEPGLHDPKEGDTCRVVECTGTPVVVAVTEVVFKDSTWLLSLPFCQQHRELADAAVADYSS